MANKWMLLFLLVGLISASTARVIGDQENKENTENTENKEGEDEDDNDIAEFIKGVEVQCLNKTGSNHTFEMIALNAAMLPLCVMSNLDLEAFPADLENLNETTRHQFFPTYCPQVRETLSCLDPITTELRKCLDPEEIEVMEIVIQMIPEGLDLVCKNDGQIFFMEGTNFEECIDKFPQYVDKCADKMSNATDVMDLSNYGPQECDELHQVRDCFSEQLVDCKATQLMDIFDLFYRPMVKASPCKNFIKLDVLPPIESNKV